MADILNAITFSVLTFMWVRLWRSQRRKFALVMVFVCIGLTLLSAWLAVNKGEL